MIQEELEKEWCRRNGFDESFAVLAPVVSEEWSQNNGALKPETKNMKCSHCKSTENLMHYAKNTTGRQYFLCRVCNTKRMAAYRATEHGRERIYAAIRKFRAKKKHETTNNS